MESNKVSIIIPAYNVEKYIHQAITSIYEQSFDGEIEVIAIDDGSTDDTAQIIKSFSTVRYAFQENAGEAVARNAGLKLATGDYIAWLDADDWYEPTKIAKQLNFLNTHPEYDFVYCDFKTFDENTRDFSVLKAESFVKGANEFLATILFRQIIPNIACTLIRRKCIEAGCVYDENRKRYAPDYSFCLMLLLNGFTPGYIPESLYGYRRHAGNVTNAHQHQKTAENEQVRDLGLKKIISIIESTSFSKHDQELLLAKILMKIGLFNDAKTRLDNLTDQINPNEAILQQFYSANINYCIGDYDKASIIFEKLIVEIETDCKLNMPSAEIYNNTACTFMMFGKFDKAIEYFNKALIQRDYYMDATKNLEFTMTLNTSSTFLESQLRAFKSDLFFTIFELRQQIQCYY